MVDDIHARTGVIGTIVNCMFILLERCTTSHTCIFKLRSMSTTHSCRTVCSGKGVRPMTHYKSCGKELFTGTRFKGIGRDPPDLWELKDLPLRWGVQLRVARYTFSYRVSRRYLWMAHFQSYSIKLGVQVETVA